MPAKPLLVMLATSPKPSKKSPRASGTPSSTAAEAPSTRPSSSWVTATSPTVAAVAPAPPASWPAPSPRRRQPASSWITASSRHSRVRNRARVPIWRTSSSAGSPAHQPWSKLTVADEVMKCMTSPATFLAAPGQAVGNGAADRPRGTCPRPCRPGKSLTTPAPALTASMGVGTSASTWAITAPPPEGRSRPGPTPAPPAPESRREAGAAVGDRAPRTRPPPASRRVPTPARSAGSATPHRARPPAG